MLSISYLFDTANVQSQHPSGLIAPFGQYIPPDEETKKLLAKAQQLSKLPLEKQQQFMKKYGNAMEFPDLI